MASYTCACCGSCGQTAAESAEEDMVMCRIVANDLFQLSNCCAQRCCYDPCCRPYCRPPYCGPDQDCDGPWLREALQRQNELLTQILGAVNNVVAILLQNRS